MRADEAVLAELRERLGTMSGRQVAEYATSRGIRRPDDESWYIAEQLHDGRMTLMWLQYHPESWD